MDATTIFLLSPAFCGGKRAGTVLREDADFPLARRLRAPEGVPLGELFTFLSGLYFRGKLAYAAAFGARPGGLPGALVITPTRGLVPPEAPVGIALLREFAEAGGVSAANPRFVEPFAAHLRALARVAAPTTRFVLLGSIASDKYVGLLLELLGERLHFPAEFVGRGDMSRGGLMLRAAAEGPELEYLPLRGAVRTGPRPPRLAPRSWKEPR